MQSNDRNKPYRGTGYLKNGGCEEQNGCHSTQLLQRTKTQCDEKRPSVGFYCEDFDPGLPTMTLIGIRPSD